MPFGRDATGVMVAVRYSSYGRLDGVYHERQQASRKQPDRDC